MRKIKDGKGSISTRNILLALLFAVFLFLRLFVKYDTAFLASDHVKFLDLAQNFPYHTSLNNQLYLIHPPFYPYLIHFVNLFIEQDHIAAILISLISASILFFLVYKLFIMLTDNFLITFTVLILLTLSVDFVIASNSVLRESFVVTLLLSALYFYIKGIKLKNKISMAAASFLGFLSALTTDHALLLLPAFAATYIFFRNKKMSILASIIPIIITVLFIGSWTFVKLYQYSTNEYYPSGLEGAPVSTKDIGIVGVLGVLNTHYFKDYEPNLPSGFTRPRDYAYRLGYMFNIFPFSIPRGLDFTSIGYLLLPKHIAYMIIFYLPLALTALFGFLFILRDFIKGIKGKNIRNNIHNNANLYIVALFLIFISLVIRRDSSPRYIYTAYIFLFYFIGYGLFMLLKKVGRLKIYNNLILIAVISLLLLTPFWYYNNPNFVLLTKKFVAANKTADFISKNIRGEDAIMAQSGYGETLSYGIKNRVLGLPPKSENLLKLINYYNVSYVLYGKVYTFDRYHYAKDSIEFIRNRPEKFELTAVINEDYGDLSRTSSLRRTNKDEIYIYKVKR